LIQRRDRKIAAVLSIPVERPRNSTEMTVMLRPTATLMGRLVNGEGKPARGGVRAELTHEAGALFHLIAVASAELDSTGQFHCGDIPASGLYQVAVANRLAYGLGPPLEHE